MSTHDSDLMLEAAQRLREDLASTRLSPALARLYSQHTRLAYAQPGLSSWEASETSERLHDAMRLTAAALAERKLNGEGWQQSLRRAGEILEWLSHPQLNEQQLPIILLASAAYQLAGYPARSTGLLSQASLPDEISQIIHGFLRADFPTVFGHLCNLWKQDTTLTEPLPWHDEQQLSEKIDSWITGETASAIGVLCSFLRWGDENRMQLAVEKLSAVAEVFLNGRDSYSWLLAKFVSNVAAIYHETSLRTSLLNNVRPQENTLPGAFEAYQRYAYSSSKALTWPSQLEGIQRLGTLESFALCTPTGSGKTTVAEIAILQSLFSLSPDLLQTDTFTKPLVLYLVPSRALAAEVESKLYKALANLIDEPVRVTGLYGGIDWGPTDAWLTTNDRTVLICTYEKAEALLKFVGPLFLYRVSLVIIDEAHQVQYYGEADSLVPSDSRQLRLESLSSRLLSHFNQESSRVIALSAVSTGYENAISDWITGSTGSSAVQTSYRSTRQLIGRLEHTRDGRTTIFYDLMDGARLQFQDGRRTGTPYIPDPFPQYPVSPRWSTEGNEKRIRPYLFWAAIHLASLEQENELRGVLISISQQPLGYAEDFLTLLNRDWIRVNIPRFFDQPSDPHKFRLWQQCLAACEDYFTRGSCEYELLEKGIVLHHGNMPGVLARLLIELINEKVVYLVLATSTLSEGVNLPFSTILLPVLHRGPYPLNLGEFRNLAGRAGRPGFGTEGRTLVMMSNQNEYGQTRVRTRYNQIINELPENVNDQVNQVIGPSSSAHSALASLLSQIERLWQRVNGSGTQARFISWLEQISPTEPNLHQDATQERSALIDSVDTLDAFLLSSIVELEQLSPQQMDVTALEDALQRVWQRTYARVALHETTILRDLFLRRGVALRSTIYPDAIHRRRLYKTGLPPRNATQLLAIYSDLLPHMKSSADYVSWALDEKFEFVRSIVESLGSVKQFQYKETVGKVPWSSVLKWWLVPLHAPIQPSRSQFSAWHKFIAGSFQYRFNWGLGSIVALALDDVYQGELRLPVLEEWPKTGLPWAIFWLKEMMIWGTLDPVAALLLSRRTWVTRREAEDAAQQYYGSRLDSEPNEVLNPVAINRWVQETHYNQADEHLHHKWPHRLQVELLRDFAEAPTRQFRVLPVERDGDLHWYDPAGFPLAKSRVFDQWEEDLVHEYDFFLNPAASVVTSQLYLS